MKTYTEAELMKAIEFACKLQKADDFDVAGQYLIGAVDKDRAIEEALKYLGNTSKNCSQNLVIEDIEEYLEK